MAEAELNIDLEDLKLAIAVVGGRWKTTILAHLAREPHRFGALRRAVEGISEKVLIQQLRELEADGMISRRVEATVPPRVEYYLRCFMIAPACQRTYSSMLRRSTRSRRKKS